MRAAVPGEERWWSISGHPISNELGNFQGFRGSGTDLTEQKRSEREINQLARCQPGCADDGRHDPFRRPAGRLDDRRPPGGDLDPAAGQG